MEFNSEYLLTILNEKFDEELKKMGIANVLIAGRSGVGKSTLINSVFGEDLTQTGQGRPVTKTTRKISKKGMPVAIFDTRGLELDQYSTTLGELETFLKESRRNQEAEDHVHVGWVCIGEDSRRVEEGESKLIELLCRYDIPVIVVITKARADKGFKDEVLKLCGDAKQVIRVRAMKELFDDGHELPKIGIDELIRATHEALPEGRQKAFAASQKVVLEIKKASAHKVILASAATAGGVAANPLPFSDAIAIVPIQMSMIAGITTSFGLGMEKSAIAGVAASVVGCTAASLAGRTIFTNLLKFVPGGGSVLGGVVAAATAITITVALGELYLATIVGLIGRFDRDPTPDEIVSEFKGIWKKRNAEE